MNVVTKPNRPATAIMLELAAKYAPQEIEIPVASEEEKAVAEIPVTEPIPEVVAEEEPESGKPPGLEETVPGAPDIDGLLEETGSVKDALIRSWEFYSRLSRRLDAEAPDNRRCALGVCADAIEYYIINGLNENAQDLIKDVMPFINRSVFVNARQEAEMREVLIDMNFETRASRNGVPLWYRKQFAAQINSFPQ